MSPLAPSNSAPATQLLQAIVAATSSMDAHVREAWRRHLRFIKGDLDGQRGATAAEMACDLGIDLAVPRSVTDLISGLDAYFVFVVNLAAVASLGSPGRARVSRLTDLTDRDLRAEVEAIASGSLFASFGVRYPRHSLDLSWWPACLQDEGLGALRDFLGTLDPASLVDNLSKQADPFGQLYLSVAPNALLHPTGEHYTPLWLAQQLVRASEWRPGERLLDPFGGSGVMLLAALREATVAGHGPLEALEQLQMIELNPVTAAIAKANLIFALRSEINASTQWISLPVLCADTLSHALPECGRGQQDLWRGRQGSASDAPSGRSTEIGAADVIVTNPPWVGWEYIPKAYRAHIEPLWVYYSLFESTGRNAAFLKEDLSTLAMAVALDRFLVEGGRASVVLRYASMTSNTAAGGLRRLHLSPSNVPLNLRKVEIFEDLRIFDHAVTKATVWHLQKGEPTRFPVPVEQWHMRGEAATIGSNSTLIEVASCIESRELGIQRVHPDDPKSRWTIGETECLRAADALTGRSAYRARTGVFTGGANAVYYLEPLTAACTAAGVAWFRNRTERARRKAPQTCMMLEQDLVYEVIRGRDVGHWQIRGRSHLLCPHTRETKMSAIAPRRLAADYPHASSYLDSMREVLDRRRGFSGWEKEAREAAFYAILRIGDYTFAPYKVAWRYVADDFIVAVIPPQDDGRPRLPNDKVMSIGCEDPMEAYYLCGVLSSDPVRWKVLSSSTSTQISASVIEPLGIATYDPQNPVHINLAGACRTGHRFVELGETRKAGEARAEVNRLVAQLFGLEQPAMEAFARACQPVDY